MRKAFTIILTALLVLSVFISCSQDDLVDDLFNSKVLVTFDANGGSGSMAVQEIRGKTLTALNANAFTREGYLFIEWNTKADGSGTAYADGASVTLTENTTLYAQWVDTSALILPTTTQLNNGIEYSIISDVTVLSRLVVNGTVSINLPAGKTLTVPKGIRVSEGNSLTIKGTGSLVITEPEEGAGIGGNSDENCGTVVIEGGTINVTGGAYCAGIGGGFFGDGGTITISGGTVTATGGTNGAAIGGGGAGDSGTITITGGTVNATGGNLAAGIGSGEQGAAESITISGGAVTAIGGANGAGIGGGTYGSGGTITISGGTVSATGGTDATGIGAGKDGEAGTITISGDAEVTSTGGKVSAIFNANGGTGTMAAQVMAKNTATALSANTFTKEDGAFDGWNTKADGTGTAYADAASVTLEYDLTLYAQWIDPSIITSSTTVWNGASISEYKLLSNVTIDSRVTVTGTVSINLAEGKTLTIPNGIRVAEGNSLTINGKGSLVIDASAQYNISGIGGNLNENCGTVIINDGIINVTGSYGGAGIGGGRAETTGGNGGTITINGGTVTATGGTLAAGIGGGWNYDPLTPVSGGTITINGGTVVATGGRDGAGIGGGSYGNAGTIAIAGGNITADGSASDGGAAGIGGGYYGNGGTITISGGTVSATGGDASPGIGAGKSGDAGAVTISGDAEVTSTGGKVSAFFNANGGTGTMAAQVMAKNTATALSANTFTKEGCTFGGWNTKADGTGTAYADAASVTLESDLVVYAQWIDQSVITSSTTAWNSAVVSEYNLISDVTIDSRVVVTGTVSVNLAEGKTLTIPKGIQVAEGNSLTITGTGSLVITAPDDKNAGIGGNLNENCGTVVIEGGTVTATGGFNAPGIGSGASDDGLAGGNITISGGTVNATGTKASAGIGGGSNGAGGTITISGGEITATGGQYGAGIGGGAAGAGGTITITGGTVVATAGEGGAGIGGAQFAAGGNITISGGTVNATGGTEAPGIGAGKDGEAGTITISGDAEVTSTGEKVSAIFNANGGTGTMAAQVMSKSTETALSANTFTKEDGAFDGWNTKADGTGTAYAGGASVSLTEDLILYAQWEEIDLSIITSSTTALDGSYISEYKLLDDVTIDSRVVVTGTVSVNLGEGKTLTIPKGIQVSEGNSLTITGTGTLLIDLPDEGNAGIGGNINENCGTVIIEGGLMSMQGGFGAAGIGGGKAVTSGGNGGTITINGGTVYAHGAFGFPGIGSGTNESGLSVSGGNITITGGTVEVSTGANSAAIGGGTNANSGTISISGGQIRIVCHGDFIPIGAGPGGTNGTISISDDAEISSVNYGYGFLAVFKANGGEGTMVPQLIEQSTATALSANTFTKEGYTFDGWNTKADGTGTAYADAASVTLESDLVLYAQW